VLPAAHLDDPQAGEGARLAKWIARKRMIRSLAALIAVAILIPACANVPPAECDSGQWGSPPPLQCDEAVTAALRAVGPGESNISHLEFQWGEYCPPAQRTCPLPDPTRGVVIFRFDDGAKDAYVQVAEGPDGIVRAVSPLIPIP
jgi:hypothetical protein